jgi:DNA adenine methylase
LARPKKLKAPFPYFGGKSRVAALVWSRLGAVSNYIEPFAGSCAVLLLRPDAPKIETLNDMDCFVGNFWRATQQDPEAVAAYADAPVNECDLHANHRWLVLSDDAEQFRRRMRREPDYFDAKVAGRWVHGLCCWIGSGWCATAETVEWEGRFAHSRGDGGHHGVHAHGEKRPKLSGGAPDSGAFTARPAAVPAPPAAPGCSIGSTACATACAPCASAAATGCASAIRRASRRGSA